MVHYEGLHDLNRVIPLETYSAIMLCGGQIKSTHCKHELDGLQELISSTGRCTSMPQKDVLRFSH